MDLIGPFKPSALEYKFVLTVTDYFSKYVEAIPIPDKSADSAAKGIYKIYCRQGAPVHNYYYRSRQRICQSGIAIQLTCNMHIKQSIYT